MDLKNKTKTKTLPILVEWTKRETSASRTSEGRKKKREACDNNHEKKGGYEYLKKKEKQKSFWSLVFLDMDDDRKLM